VVFLLKPLQGGIPDIPSHPEQRSMFWQGRRCCLWSEQISIETYGRACLRLLLWGLVLLLQFLYEPLEALLG
jgi:hypothetical protein